MPREHQQQPFVGFALPTSNTTYTPNQFFDVCLPHYPRGVVRLVAFMIRKTLGWCDAEGRPQAEQHAVSYADLERAGIGRAMIRQALDEAIAGQFIRCVREPQSSAAGKPAVSGLYELRWDERGDYVKDAKRFRGFFAGEGNRTYIPNQFFDHVVPNQRLAVVKVVGAVIRFSIGFQTKWGHRRRNVALSYQHIQNYTRSSDRKTLGAAIQHALNSNYVERVEEGYFDPDGGRLSKAAVYALKWLNEAVAEPSGSKTPPVEIRPENRYGIATGTGSKNPPADRFENPTGIEIKQTNKTLKQQEAAAATFEKLKAEGFDAAAAQAIASRYPFERVERQIRWLAGRKVSRNRLGLLRTAIEQDWPAPGKGKPSREQLGRPNSSRPSGASFGDALEQARQRLAGSTNSSPTTTP